MRVNDLVFVGNPAPLTEKVVWRIAEIHDGNAVLVSGLTERRAVYPLERLTKFTPRLREPAAP